MQVLGLARSCNDCSSAEPFNSISVAAAAIGFLAVWFTAIYLPARRATRIAPTLALRWE